MIEGIDIEKSFYMLGDSMNHCFNCKYCRTTDTQYDKVSFSTIPTELNSNFNNIPIAINLFYGDPFLQVDNTYSHLCRLRDSRHKGPIVIITKGDISNIEWLRNEEFIDLDLHIAFSTFGMIHEYDKHSHNQFLKNLTVDIRFKRSIEFRPICYQINDSAEVIENIFKLANKYNLPIGYSGLQGKPFAVKHWEKMDYTFEPYPKYKFGHKKSISDDIQKLFDTFSKYYDVPIFRKTSCLLSYVRGLDRDYNAHYYRPDEMNCDMCIIKDKCFKFKDGL